MASAPRPYSLNLPILNGLDVFEDLDPRRSCDAGVPYGFLRIGIRGVRCLPTVTTRTITAVVVMAVVFAGCAVPVGTSASTSSAPSTTTHDSIETPSTVAAASTTSTTTAAPLSREVVKLEVRTRESWGAQPPDRELEGHVVDTITIHHTGQSLGDMAMEERLQEWQNYHQSMGSGDIAYHMIIAPDGTVYAGREHRFVGSTRTSYDPTGHFLPALEGMFDEFWDSPDDGDDEPDGADELSDAQLGALIDVLAWASAEFGVDPAEITGHRDYAATACPGSVVHEMIQSGEIERLVNERIESVDIELVYVSQ